MGQIDYKSIYDRNKHGWYDMTEDPQKYEALLAGHYSDSNHFVYELLQNAEDEHAERVVIEYYHDKLVFYHDGDQFDENDVRGVSSMLMGTKDKDDASSIGRFGMGFKSVFKYTYQPEIYSDDEAFKITKYLLPVEITEEWDYQAEKKNIMCKIAGGSSFAPFYNAEHLTKIIIPFIKYNKKGDLESVPGDDVLKKLNELDGEILLFLSSIKTLYWINKENGKHALISLKVDESDEKLITCRIAGSEYGEKEDITRYLKFTDKFNHKEMKGAEVSVAYKINARADNINEVDDAPVWVYFPTRDETNLPFLIHGSFETAVSREKLMTPSKFNSDLFDRLGDLIAGSLTELAERKLITQAFIRKILLAAFKDEKDNDTIPGLKEKITATFQQKALLPDRNGNYLLPDDVAIPVPFRFADFAERGFLKEVFKESKAFVFLNDENGAYFSDYFNWLTKDLNIEIYSLLEFAKASRVLDGFHVGSSGEDFDTLKDLYDFLSDNRIELHRSGSYWRISDYEQALRGNLEEAWEALRHAPIIVNRVGILVPAYRDKKPSVYLAASSDYKSVMQAAIVNLDIANSFKTVLVDGFQINEFDNFQYIKEKVLKKYIDIEDRLAFENPDDYVDEYVEDINQILSLLETSGNDSDVKEILKKASIIKIVKENGEDYFSYPNATYLSKSDEGIDLRIYYKEVVKEETDDADGFEMKFGYNLVDEEFYEQHGISPRKLIKLGVISTPVSLGTRQSASYDSKYWIALDEYCPNLLVDCLDDNVEYIEEYPEDELAQQKSAEMLQLLLRIYKKIAGKKRFNKVSSYIGQMEICNDLYFTLRSSWLYDKEGNIHSTKELSKYDLNPAIYKDVDGEKAAYEVLGFIEKEADNIAGTFEKVDSLEKKDKLVLLNQLARELGREVIVPGSRDDEWEESQDVFSGNTWIDNEFPVNRIRNRENLVRHVQEQFFCADPVTYKQVLRQIRASKSSKVVRAYAMGMYTNSSDVKICQICKDPVAHAEVIEVANYGIEMPQLNICTCPNCAAKYKAIRDVNKDDFKQKMRLAIIELDIEEQEDEYSIEVNQDLIIHFTQTHIAEIQEIFRLLAEYGLPHEEQQELDEDDEQFIPSESHERISKAAFSDTLSRNSNSLLIIDEDDVIARKGCLITYKKKWTGECYDNTLQPDKFPLHKAFEGHGIGDVIKFQNKEYEITGIIN